MIILIVLISISLILQFQIRAYFIFYKIVIRINAKNRDGVRSVNLSDRKKKDEKRVRTDSLSYAR